MTERRSTAVVTGVGRRQGIGASIATGLAADGWDLVLGYWGAYDERFAPSSAEGGRADVVDACRSLGSRVELIEADLATVEAPERLMAAADAFGGPRALVLSHCESVDSAIHDTTVESWDRHFAVNARAAWLLIKAFAERIPDAPSTAVTGRIVALTSDHTAHNLPYGASKGALDRLVIAAAIELGPRGVRANAVNPGPIDTGWMTDEIREAARAGTPAGRLGTPEDTAALVRFLLSEAGGWISGQLLSSSGGFHTAGGHRATSPDE